MGCVYQQGRIWWIKYYRQGVPSYESSGSDKKSDASDLLKLREGDIIRGQAPGVCLKRVTLQELAEDFLSDYRLNGRKSLERASIATDHLLSHITVRRVSDITTNDITSYITLRLQTLASPATVNRELATLKRMFTMGAQRTPPKVGPIPHIPMLQENNVRRGFFEHKDYLALLAAAPDYAKPVISFAYYTGWRKGEILNLTWNQVDLDAHTVQLSAADTKSGEPRMVYLNDDLSTQLQHLRTISNGTPYVFTCRDHQIQGFRSAWKKVCELSGNSGKLFHDFRRTAVRNMIRAGIPERIAMARSGHKTRSVFDRYNIVDGEDHRQAANKLQVYLEG